MHGFVPGLVCSVAAAVAIPCVWDTDTLRDELQTKASTFDLITGQFPHHGQAYYEHRRKRLVGELAQHPKDLTRRNDLAVALLKLGRFDESAAQFAKIEAQAPGRYETLSNLGVLHKKRGDFAKASELLAAALKLKPEGHLGIGDYYLKEMEFLARSSRGGEPETDFLGRQYERPAFLSEDETKRVEGLIRADRHFADAVLVLAIGLRWRFDLNLSLYAFMKAKALGHPRTDVIDAGIDDILKHWREAAGHNRDGSVVDPKDETLAAIAADLERAADWVQQFEAIEAELVAQQGEVDFATVEAEMTRRGIHRVRPPDRGVRRSVWGLLRNPLVWFLLLGAALAGLGLWRRLR